MTRAQFLKARGAVEAARRTSSDDHTYRWHSARCPYCGHEELDSWEIALSDGQGEGDGVVECGGCEREYLLSRFIEVSYRSKPMPAATPTPDKIGYQGSGSGDPTP
jgi:hypothetical protein